MNRHDADLGINQHTAARRLRVTWVAEYPAYPADYEDSDPVKMAAQDNQAALDGDLDLLGLMDGAETVELRFEVAP